VLGFLRAFFKSGRGAAPGREFTPEEEALTARMRSLFSNRFWPPPVQPLITRSSGKTTSDGHVYPIVGVMPPSFLFPNRARICGAPSPRAFLRSPRENNGLL